MDLVVSHESCPPHLLARASVMEARQLGGGSHGERAARWRRARQTGSGEECGVEEAARGDNTEEAGRGWARGAQWAADSGKTKWGGRIGTVTHGGNDTASIEARNE
jgi:hypothetical protein